MSQAVIIKSSKNGINLVLDASMPFPELLTEILHKFTEAERFFANASFAISFEGRELSDEEKYQIVDAIMEQTRVKILCILDSDEIRDAVIEQKCREMQQTNEEKEARRQSRGCFYRGSLLPGERLDRHHRRCPAGSGGGIPIGYRGARRTLGKRLCRNERQYQCHDHGAFFPARAV